MTLPQDLSYWKTRLDAMPASVDLPTDRPRSAPHTFHEGTYHFRIDDDVVAKATDLGQRHHATLFTVLLAAFNVLLARYTGREDIVVGTCVRLTSPECGGAAQPLNTILLRTDLAGDPAFVTLLRRVRDTLHDALEHRDLPFERLVELLPPGRDVTRHPIMQVMILHRTNAASDIANTAGAEATRRSPADLVLLVSEGREAVTARLTYNAGLFDQETIEALSTHFRNILENVTRDPEALVWRLRLLDPRERHRLLVEWNQTHRDFPSVCVHHLFEAAVRRTPHDTAVIHGDRSISYVELDRRANRLAHHLIATGVGPDHIVGLCIERSIEMVIALLGILKAGAAYLPLDPTHPSDRLAFTLTDSGTQIVVTAGGTGVPAGARCHVVSLKDDRSTLEAQPDSAPRSGVGPHNLAYVIYTSGSTGRPKGVMIPHQAITNYAQAALSSLGLHNTRRAVLHTSICFDLGFTVLLPALIAGAELVLATNEATITALRHVIARHPSGLGAIKLTPTHLSLLEGVLNDQSNETLFSTIIVGGERLTFEQLRFIRRRFPSVKIWNHYGPTEATVGACIFPILRDDSGYVPIGRPLPNTRVYILDKALQPVPIGVPGELFIAGAGVAQGYLNRPDLTAERFIDHTFDGTTERMYRTGDQVRYRRDGNVEFLGRLDRQVKIRGYRIELEEIEMVLSDHPNTKQAVAVVHHEANDYQRVVAYIVPRSLDSQTHKLFGDHVKARLPAYMIPSDIVLLEALPLTPNGKIDRVAIQHQHRRPLPGGGSARASDEQGECKGDQGSDKPGPPHASQHARRRRQRGTE